MNDAATPAPRADGHAARRRGTRAQVIEAAVRLVAERGFSATSVDDIALAAGVAKGSVYYNFGSKSDILEAALTEGGERLQATISAARGDLRGREALAAVVGALLTAMQANPDFAKLMAAEVFRVERVWQETIGALRSVTIATFAEVISEIAPAEDTSLVGAATFGAVLVAGLEWLLFQPGRSVEDVRASVLRLTSGL